MVLRSLDGAGGLGQWSERGQQAFGEVLPAGMCGVVGGGEGVDWRDVVYLGIRSGGGLMARASLHSLCGFLIRP